MRRKYRSTSISVKEKGQIFIFTYNRFDAQAILYEEKNASLFVLRFASVHVHTSLVYILRFVFNVTDFISEHFFS